MEMQTPEGYRLMNWGTGYGDWQARPDWGTLRVIPWLERTALVLADRTCGFRIVGSGGHGHSLRSENRIPGADADPYLPYAACLAAGLHGIERRLEPPAEYRGNAYTATDVARVPRSPYEAITRWERSAVARAAFGDDVAEHYLNMARVEQQTYAAAVTNWERERYLERG